MSSDYGLNLKTLFTQCCGCQDATSIILNQSISLVCGFVTTIVCLWSVVKFCEVSRHSKLDISVDLALLSCLAYDI